MATGDADLHPHDGSAVGHGCGDRTPRLERGVFDIPLTPAQTGRLQDETTYTLDLTSPTTRAIPEPIN